MPIYLVWAYHSASDALVQHSQRGAKQVTLIPAVTSTMMMMMTTTSIPAIGKFCHDLVSCYNANKNATLLSRPDSFVSYHSETIVL